LPSSTLRLVSRLMDSLTTSKNRRIVP